MIFTKFLYRLFRQTIKGDRYKIVYQPGLIGDKIEITLSRPVEADDLRGFWREFLSASEDVRYVMLLSFLVSLDLEAQQ